DASTNVNTFSSNYVQNQDNIASLEYSVDGGDYTDSGATGTWHPVLYYLEPTDLLTDEEGNFSAELTLLGEAEGSGIEYGFYTLAPEYVADLQELAPYFAARQDDGYKDGKRFEKHRLPLADHKTQVRFRWGFMGTWSWYWGVDHVQIWGDNGTGIGDWSLF
ncbi:MAG: hypothetical protein RBU29_12995, partial [bacterium]|nr:hypothetical protein [bacterium]